nr:MAG TPA: tail component [Caudoviricetes sp.]
MIDINQEARKTLNKLETVTVTYQYPRNFNTLPIVTYYTLTERSGMAYDNTEVMQDGTIQIDIWGSNAKICTDLAIQIHNLMVTDGWNREMSMDIPNPDREVYHKTMRLTKSFQL